MNVSKELEIIKLLLRKMIPGIVYLFHTTLREYLIKTCDIHFVIDNMPYNSTGIDSYQMQEMIESKISLRFDTNSIPFKAIHKKEGKYFSKELLKGKIGLIKLHKIILRNSFLYGCLFFTNDKKNEHLIIGYGDRYGGGVDIQYYYHIVGSEDSINLSNEEIVLGQIGSILPKKQLIVFHNHPMNNYTKFVRTPIPSRMDRETLLHQKYLFPFQIIRKFTDEKEGMKFFLGENGKVIEYRTPAISSIFNLLRSTNWR